MRDLPKGTASGAHRLFGAPPRYRSPFPVLEQNGRIGFGCAKARCPVLGDQGRYRAPPRYRSPFPVLEQNGRIGFGCAKARCPVLGDQGRYRAPPRYRSPFPVLEQKGTGYATSPTLPARRPRLWRARSLAICSALFLLKSSAVATFLPSTSTATLKRSRFSNL